jgi:hypothetical protein
MCVVNLGGLKMKEYVPKFNVNARGIFASAKDKAWLDKYLADKGKPPIRVEVVEPPPSTGRRLM